MTCTFEIMLRNFRLFTSYRIYVVYIYVQYTSISCSNLSASGRPAGFTWGGWGGWGDVRGGVEARSMPGVAPELCTCYIMIQFSLLRSGWLLLIMSTLGNKSKTRWAAWIIKSCFLLNDEWIQVFWYTVFFFHYGGPVIICTEPR